MRREEVEGLPIVPPTQQDPEREEKEKRLRGHPKWEG
jgi:hypothetical protein